MKRKIAVTTGTRAEYGILRSIIKKILESKKLELELIVCGMHLSKKYGNTINEIKKDGFPIIAKVNMIPKGDLNFHMADALGTGIIQFAKIFRKIKPDINLVLGDRDEALASSMAAYHMNIPNAHIHGGDKTLAGIDEYNRHAITKISNIHFAATKKSFQRIEKMGEYKKNIFLTGSPSIDEVANQRITEKKELEKKYKIKFSGKEILLLQHPVTTQSNFSKKQIENILKAIVKTGKPTIAISPNSDAGNNAMFKILKKYAAKYNFIKNYPSLPRNDYLGMLRNCKILIGNSSSGIVEAGYFDITVINVGIRQKNREGNNDIINVKGESMIEIYKILEYNLNINKKIQKKNFVYGRGNASKKIVEILEKIELNKKLIEKQITY
jgi:UDP-N-acetylglucosamine 2-epimerase (non-hydrolysing)/GDP/UDP-N,N'-diacetylbacillosamine 2-epimerase (hydrolysing)